MPVELAISPSPAATLRPTCAAFDFGSLPPVAETDCMDADDERIVAVLERKGWR